MPVLLSKGVDPYFLCRWLMLSVQSVKHFGYHRRAHLWGQIAAGPNHLKTLTLRNYSRQPRRC
jgi:hypothetical protein